MHCDTDHNLLFGVLALQAGLLDPPRFAEACAAWAARKDAPLADLLVARGWLDAEERDDLERLLRRTLLRHGGQPRASLAALPGASVARQALASVADPEVQASLAVLTPSEAVDRPTTTDYHPPGRGRYTVTGLHAQGGIGRVWLARDHDLGRDVALKELRPDRADRPDLAARFVAEAQVTGQLEHPGIVPVYEMARGEDGQAFYTMRFVRGRTLTDAVQAHHDRAAAGAARPLELRELLTAFVAICNAVAFAHARGVVHRDLKGGNVVLGDFGEVMVLDWGLARLVGKADGPEPPVAVAPVGEDGETVQGQVLGTPGYMAPEQARGLTEQIGPHSDVYGLGAILCEILTARPPFSGAGELHRHPGHAAGPRAEMAPGREGTPGGDRDAARSGGSKRRQHHRATPSIPAVPRVHQPLPRAETLQ
jgi:hypothetical protein